MRRKAFKQVHQGKLTLETFHWKCNIHAEERELQISNVHSQGCHKDNCKFAMFHFQIDKLCKCKDSTLQIQVQTTMLSFYTKIMSKLQTSFQKCWWCQLAHIYSLLQNISNLKSIYPVGTVISYSIGHSIPSFSAKTMSEKYWEIRVRLETPDLRQ